jgi:hypothetical protein
VISTGAFLVAGCGSSARRGDQQITVTSGEQLYAAKGTSRKLLREIRGVERDLNKSGGCAVISHDRQTGKFTAKPCKHR